MYEKHGIQILEKQDYNIISIYNFLENKFYIIFIKYKHEMLYNLV